LIRVKDISLSFNGTAVFNNLSFHIETDENACISGPSGKGKSSLLKILQGYILPDTGVIEVNGKKLDSKNIRHIRSMMAYIPQNINPPAGNGRELAKLTGYGGSMNNVYRFIEQLGLPHEMLDQSFDEISGGQKQRIVTAVCLSLGKSIILLDEPTSSLDDVSITNMMEVIQNLRNSTIISASHNIKWIRSAGKIIRL
jgi:putative ABC transport system ATP-binding protein